LRHVHLRAGEERQDDARKGADEREPVGDRDREDIPDGDARRQLDEGDGQAQLDRDRARQENRRGQNGRQREFAHRSTSKVVTLG
jgi:hypothetical protein